MLVAWLPEIVVGGLVEGCLPLLLLVCILPSDCLTAVLLNDDRRSHAFGLANLKVGAHHLLALCHHYLVGVVEAHRVKHFQRHLLLVR